MHGLPMQLCGSLPQSTKKIMVFLLFTQALITRTADSQPVVSISPGYKISTSLSKTVNLNCSVIFPDSSPGIISSITWKFGTEVLSDGVSTMLDQGVSSLGIGSIKSGQAGSYSCEAVVDGLTYANTANITVQLPSVNDPALSPFPFIATYYSGIEIAFLCIFSVDINAINNDPDANVTTNWKKGDTKLTSDSRITVNIPKPVPGSDGVFSGSLKFDYLSRADSGDYRCEVFVISSVDSDFVVETSASSTIMVTVNAPKPDVSLISTPVCVDSDSNVSLTCTATLPLSHKLEFAKVFKWTMNGNITSSASDPTDPKGVVSVSTLNHRMTTSGVFVFECEVSINVTGDPVVTNSSTLTINVQEALPNCSPGFKVNHSDCSSCQDVNECKNNNGGCSHRCSNTNGSFFCSCKEGYQLQGDGLTCEECPSPICSPRFCKRNKGATCVIDNKAINPRGCVISNCLGCVYHDKALTYPPKSCQDKKDCIKPTGIDEACMRSWAWCLRRDFKSKINSKEQCRSKGNFKCWEYPYSN